MFLGLLPLSTEAACGWTPSAMNERENERENKSSQPDVLFLPIGGNDISPVSDPKKIFKGICELVQDFQNAGVRHMSMILQRADFSKTQPPGLSMSKLRCIDVSTTLF